MVTSYLHWYFYDTDAVRPEDWHRSTYLVILTELRRLAGETAILLTKLLFVGIVLTNFLLVSLLAKRAYAHPEHESQRLGFRVFFVLVFTVMVVNSWMPRLLAADYLDDMPASLCGFLAATLLVLRGPKFTTCLALGFFVALAFSIKNLSLVLFVAFLLSIVVITALEQKARRTITILSRTAAYAASYAVFIAPVLYWNMKDLGLLLPEQARLGLIGRLRSDSLDGEHDLYFLKPDLELAHSWFDLVLEKGLANQLWDGWLLTLAAMRYGWVVLLIATLGLLGAWVARRRRRPTVMFIRLTVIFVFSLFGFMSFFTLQLGEAGQLRYWIFPFGLGAALGVGGLLTFFQAFSMVEILDGAERALLRKPDRLSKATLPASGQVEPKGQPSAVQRLERSDIAKCLLSALLLTLILNAVGQSAHPASNLWRRSHGYPDEITQRLAELSGSGSIMAHTNVGVNYWIDYPMTNIVGIGPLILTTLTNDQLSALVERYNVHVAVYNDWERVGHVNKYDTVDFLLANGFCEDSDFEGFVILLWQGDEGRGGECASQS